MDIEREKRVLEEYQALLEAWENVEIVTKKDGTPFKALKRNFKNCVFFKRYNMEYIGVSTSRDRHYYHDDLFVWGNNGVEGVKQQIEDRINAFKGYVEGYKEEIDIIENNTINMNELADEIMSSIKEKCNGNIAAISYYKFELMEKLKEKY